MPYWFDYDSSHQILRGHVDGVTGDEDLLRYYSAARTVFERLQPRSAITDFSGVTAFDVSANTIRQLAAAPPALAKVEVPRFVVAPQPNVYGIARMFQQLGQETRPSLVVVRSADEAYAALGVATPRFEPVAESAA
jgi:hypothetical protein